jgi:hypothetical protein
MEPIAEGTRCHKKITEALDWYVNNEKALCLKCWMVLNNLEEENY